MINQHMGSQLILLLFLLSSSIFLIGKISIVHGLPQNTWNTVPLYAHCGNSSGPLDISVAQFFARLSFVTIEKWHALEAEPMYHGAEGKIRDASKLIKSFGTNVEVYMYYQNDWTRTWYDSGVKFEEHEHLLLHDKDGVLVQSPVEYGHQFYAYDFSKPAAQEAWVEACLALIDINATQPRTHNCDGVFVDGYRGPAWRFELLKNCSERVKTAWIEGAYQATKMLAERLGPDRVLLNNPYSVASPAANGVMVEYFARPLTANYSKTSILEDLAILKHEGSKKRFVAVHLGSDEAHFQVSLAAFLVGAQERQYLGTGRVWEDCADWGKDRPEYWYPLGAPLSGASTSKDSSGFIEVVRQFASGTHVKLRVPGPGQQGEPTSCIWWSNGIKTGSDCN